MNHHRAGVRIPVELPVQIRWRSRQGAYREAQGKTGNISGNGLFMAVPVRLRRQTPITFRVMLPTEVTRIPLELLCQGRVVRQSQAGEVPGIGAIIDDYELRPANRPH